jgi:hypothetical protein
MGVLNHLEMQQFNMNGIEMYKLVDGFLYRDYRPLERKIIEHPHAQVVLKVMGSALSGSIDYKNLWGFIEAHSVLKNLLSSEKELKMQLHRLVQIGVISQIKIG